MENIIKINRNEFLINIIKRLIDEKRYREAITLLEKIEIKDYNTFRLTIELYILEGSYIERIKFLKKIFNYKELTSFESLMIAKELANNKKWGSCFSFLKTCLYFFSYDPSLKEMVIKLLINNNKYSLAYLYTRRFKNYIPYERYMFYIGYILKAMGKKLLSLFYFKRLVKNYPFNIVYRYFISTILEELNFKRSSRKHINFAKNFVNSIPKLTTLSFSNNNINEIMFNNIWEEFIY